METHHLFHLAAVYPTTDEVVRPSTQGYDKSPIITRGAGEFTASHQSTQYPHEHVVKRTGPICASAVQMVFAQRQSLAFITPDEVKHREEWVGKAVLKTLVTFPLENVHPDEGSVWHTAVVSHT
ncbi:hypothetical protein FRC03_011391 [Tulasnella sp. 419]|nr:hypothetical protein FRC03_011391 [Tulasnella sp. 419]